MVFSFYSPYTNEYIAQVEKIVSLLEDCILPKFENIREKSTKASMQVLDASMRQPATEESDSADLVEEAIDAGVDTYQSLSGLKQGMVNFFAAAIYQCFKQQWQEFENINSRRLSLVQTCRKATGTWKDIDRELRLVANTAKHGKGPSFRELREIRPDLFRPQEGKFPSFDPWFGSELYLSVQDVRRYRDLLVRFWKELTEILDEKEAAFGRGERAPDV